MWLLAVFGAGALVLAAVGVYAVLAYAVARRTREIGIRLALGARAGDVLGIVMRQGLVSVVIGLAVGVAGSAALSAVLRRVVFGISAIDPPSFAGGAAVLLAVSVFACMGPAWRACRLDANRALREE
jgi:ABC-type antimicrobial peptide transport system permease subunit